MEIFLTLINTPDSRCFSMVSRVLGPGRTEVGMSGFRVGLACPSNLNLLIARRYLERRRLRQVDARFWGERHSGLPIDEQLGLHESRDPLSMTEKFSAGRVSQTTTSHPRPTHQQKKTNKRSTLKSVGQHLYIGTSHYNGRRFPTVEFPRRCSPDMVYLL